MTDTHRFLRTRSACTVTESDHQLQAVSATSTQAAVNSSMSVNGSSKLAPIPAKSTECLTCVQVSPDCLFELTSKGAQRRCRTLRAPDS